MNKLRASMENDPHFRQFYRRRQRRRHARVRRSFKRQVERASLYWGDMKPSEARRILSGLRNP